LFHYYDFKKLLKLEELLAYSRKSRTDDPLMTVDEVLSKHETILDEWCENNLGGKLSENNKYREVVSGESMSDREAFQALLKRIESPKIKAVLVVELQRLGRPDLEEIGKITKIFRYTHTMIITPNRAYDLQDEDDRDSFERELKRGNEYLEYQKKIMSRGRLLSVSQGNYIGSVPPYGYNKVWVVEGKTERPTLAENKEQADIVRMIFDMYVNQNMGVNLIGKHLDNLHIQPPR
jgi:DNA invertase Pin-like site-specific DNA recombinase